MSRHRSPIVGGRIAESRHWLIRGVICLPLLAVAAGHLAAGPGGEVPDRHKAIKKARQSGGEYLQAGKYERAVQYFREVTRRYPEDGELHRLLAAAALDRTIQLENELETASARLYLASMIDHTLSSRKMAAFEHAEGVVRAAVVAAREAYEKKLATRGEIQTLLREASSEAEAVLSREGPGSKAALLAAWIDGYRSIEADAAATILTRFQRIQSVGAPFPGGLVAEERAGQRFDRKLARQHALRALAELSQARPDDPAPYLAAAEWLQLVEARGPAGESKLDAVRNRRFRVGIVDRDPSDTDKAAREEYQSASRAPITDLTTVGPAQLLALYEQAARRDPKDQYGTAYALYVQVLPGDLERGRQLLDSLARRDPANTLIDLERARLSAASGDTEGMVRHLNIPAPRVRFHRPLFTSLPKEIRQPFLSAHLVWRGLEEAGFGFDYIPHVLQQMAREAQPGAEKQQLWLVKARAGALLMQSDLPHDWVLGVKLRRDALGALARDKNLAPDLAARLQVEQQQMQADLDSRSLPLLLGILHQDRLTLVPVTDRDEMIVGACIIADTRGTVMIGE